MRSKSIFLLASFSLFLTAGLLTTCIVFKLSSPTVIASGITERLNEQLKIIDQQLAAVRADASKGTVVDLSTKYSFFEYRNQQLVYWSDNRFIPALQMVKDTFSLRLLKTTNGDYLAKKWILKNDHFLLAVIPLHKKYTISNGYLNQEWNENIFPQNNIIIRDPAAGDGIPIYAGKQCVFRIVFLSETLHYHPYWQWVAVTSLFLSGITLIFFLSGQLLTIQKRRAEWRFVFWAAVLLSIRMVMVKINFPNIILNSKLFDPKNFASSSYNASMGDLILNELAVLALCYYLFKNYQRMGVLTLIYKKKILGLVLSVISAVCVFFAMLYPFVVIQTIYNNSSISLDISQSLQLDLLRITALLAIVISWACAFLFSHVFIRLMIHKGSLIYSVLVLAGGAILSSCINQYSGQVYSSSLVIGCFYFLLIYSLKLYSSLSKVSYVTFMYLLVTLLCYSVNSACCIEYFNREERIDNQFRFANNFLIDRDYFGEYLLHELAVEIGKDIFIQNRMNSPFLSKDIIRHKVRQVFLPSYFNKYDVEISLFNSSGNPIDNHSTATLSELIKVYDQDAFKTDYKEVYVINSPSAEVTQKNLVIVPINRSGAVTGYVIVGLSLKKIIPENVYPELLVDNRFQQFYKTKDLSYAVFLNNTLMFSAGEFNYERVLNRVWLENPELYTRGLREGGYIHIAQMDNTGKVAVVSSRDPSLAAILSNFSFMLAVGLFVIIVLILVQGLLGYFNGTKLFFSARIQLFLNLSFFLPLMVVSITTLSLISHSLQEQLISEYRSKSKTLGAQIAPYLDTYLKSRDEDPVDFENQLATLAQFTNLDANVYNLRGMVTATSQPLIFENNLLSAYINPMALQKIRKGEGLLIEKEAVGKLEYFVSYSGLQSPQSGKLIGILAIPFFQSVDSLEKIQIVIFTNIINIFVGIFLVLLGLSYFVSEWLTFPLRFITQSLSKTSLIKINQPLIWQADDEIGLMVKEYNQMLYKLGESKTELKQIERERAWREIAQQVAHEIKNPLTPMKLTLQQLERSMQAGTHSPDKTGKALLSLLTQVDTLNGIASSFSSFAKMPEPVIHKIELIALLKQLVSLHNQSGEITFNASVKELFIQGDESLLGRTFSNIVLNALQAAKPGMTPEVIITVSLEIEKCRIAFYDKGKGIAPEDEDQVFIPHFSTKKSGSGLGLAIAKQSIEQLGGRIWFDTSVGTGTTFYIELLRAQ